MDLISPYLNGHHERVAYIAYSIARQMQLPYNKQREILLAGALHDSGALSLEERLHSLSFEDRYPYLHAELGYNLFKNFTPLSNSALLIRHHHDRWDNFKDTVPLGSHILHLSDRIEVLIDKHEEILGQVNDINSRIFPEFGHMFMPALKEIYTELNTKESFWLNIMYNPIEIIKKQLGIVPEIQLNINELLELANIFRRMIDFRSVYTAAHSASVAAVAQELANLFGFSEYAQELMKIAGYLHDLGKLAVPQEILEKPAKLNDYEFNIMRSHVFYTYRILANINGLEQINEWASLHHERLNGKGYPFHLKAADISFGSRIMAVADVFTAIAEDRPYRKGLSKDQIIRTLSHMGVDSLDSKIVNSLIEKFEYINDIRYAARSEALNEYNISYVDESG